MKLKEALNSPDAEKSLKVENQQTNSILDDELSFVTGGYRAPEHCEKHICTDACKNCKYFSKNPKPKCGLPDLPSNLQT